MSQGYFRRNATLPNDLKPPTNVRFNLIRFQCVDGVDDGNDAADVDDDAEASPVGGRVLPETEASRDAVALL